MQAIFRSKSSESSLSTQVVHFNQKTSEVVLPETNAQPKPALRTRLVLFVRNSKWGGVPFAVLYGCYMYYLITFLMLSDPTPVNRKNEINR